MSHTKSEIEQTLDDKLSLLVQDVVRAHELPGLAVGVVADHEIVYARGFGVQSIETQEPVSTTTIFHMASISKPFVATAVVQLVEQGLVQLDAPVVDYVPYFRLDDDRVRDVTVQQMLSHVSGMPDVEDYEWDQPQYDDDALERYVRSLSSEKLLSDPGEKFAYSNMAFECLGALVAQVSGLTFDDYVKRHILDPAGMVESSFLKPAHLPGNWAAPHVRVLTRLAWSGYPYNRMHGPSSTLHSNALEMCHWAIANLNRGRWQGRQILHPASYDLLWSPRAAVGDDRQVGLSWFLGTYRGERTVGHGGGDIGFNTNLVLLPDRGAAVVVLCNLLPAPVEQIAHSALDVLLGHEPDPIRPYVGIPVGQTLRAEGLDAAVARWRGLQAEHPDEYDFGPAQCDDLFIALFIAMSLERMSDAENLARLYARVLPKPDLQAIEDDLVRYPGLARSEAVLRAFRERG